MKKRICFVLLLMSCSLCLCFMSSTYSRYVAGTTGNIDILFAKWQILINNEDITNQNNSSITINPIIPKAITIFICILFNILFFKCSYYIIFKILLLYYNLKEILIQAICKKTVTIKEHL